VSSRRLLFECTVQECGHLFQLWVEGVELHVHAECDDCEKIGLEAAFAAFGPLPVQRVD